MLNNASVNLKAAVILCHFINHTEQLVLQNFFRGDDFHADD